jgi:hypothetical protein
MTHSEIGDIAPKLHSTGLVIYDNFRLLSSGRRFESLAVTL